MNERDIINLWTLFSGVLRSMRFLMMGVVDGACDASCDDYMK